MIDCFCFSQEKDNIRNLLSISFLDVEGDPESTICEYMYDKKSSKELGIMASGFAIIVINELLKALFEFLIGIEKNHSKSDDTISLFWKSTIMQFVNMTIIQLVLGFKIDGFENF